MSPRLPAELIADLVDAGSREHYSDAALYDYEYRRRRADLAFYRELARRRLPDGGRILELGAGSGRITVALARAGYEVVAIDQSAAMLDKLRSRVAALPAAVAKRITVVEGDLRSFLIPSSARNAKSEARGPKSEVRSPKSEARGPKSEVRSPNPETFPLVIAVFNVLEHLYTRVEVDACLRCVVAHLDEPKGKTPGGTFAFDVQLPDLAWLIRDPNKRWAKTRFTDPTTGRAMLYSTNHDYDPVGQIALIRLYYEPADGKGPTKIVKLSQRKFFPAELEALIAHAGLRVTERFGDFGWRPLDATAESQVLVCEKAISRRGNAVSRRGFSRG
jgi:SAM-dependent methyltransferase